MAADLNLRNLDPKLIARLKSDAALAGKTLREWCIGLLGGSDGKQQPDAEPERLPQDSGNRTGNRAKLPVVRSAKSSTQRLRKVQPVRRELARQRDASAELPQSQPSGCPHGYFSQAACRNNGGGC